MQLNDFNFELPAELIAKYPLAKRSASRLLYLEASHGNREHKHFHELVNLLECHDLLVFNDTKVMPARLIGNKTSGGKVEILVERVLDKTRMIAQLRACKAPKLLSRILLVGKKVEALIVLTIIKKVDAFYILHLEDPTQNIYTVIETLGQIPLPPYLHRLPDENDKERYQTIYAEHKGSVAAPTAGFHFDTDLFDALLKKKVNMGYLTLHIGAGTFGPLRTSVITDHKMHAEWYTISPKLCEQIKATKARGGRIIAVGTTTLRALESASQHGKIEPFNGETDIFIYPGYQFRCVDALVTNFHLPASTLLMLVCAFAGQENVMRAYREAVEKSYRFYSYGDAMFALRNNS